MTSAAATKRWTYDDLLELPDEGERYEIIDGELFVNPSPVPRHQRVVRILMIAIDRHFERHGGGEVFGSPVDVLFADGSVVQPDLIVIKSDRAAIVGPKNVQGPPNLCIEVLSDSTRRRDEIQKLELYDRGGVDEYWIVDPELEFVKVDRRVSVKAPFARAEEISTESGGAITTPLLAGFALDVHDLFEFER